MSNRPLAIICDLDGTLANIDHRMHLFHEKKWDEFQEAMVNDAVNIWCQEIMVNLDYPLILISGRSEKYRIHTMRWLSDIGHYFGDRIYLREDNNNEQDAFFKKRIYETKIKDKYDVLFVLEDRTQCVQMWRELGLVCLQCAKGDY
jgi:FMN phosphatase YigB (HAD superfamily)